MEKMRNGLFAIEAARERERERESMGRRGRKV